VFADEKWVSAFGLGSKKIALLSQRTARGVVYFYDPVCG